MASNLPYNLLACDTSCIDENTQDQHQSYEDNFPAERDTTGDVSEMIIEGVRKSCIWDVSSHSHKDKFKKIEAWKRVFSALKLPESECQKTFEKLRDNYRKTERKTRSGSGVKKLPVCEYFKELSFLRDILTTKPKETNLPDASSDNQSLNGDISFNTLYDVPSPADSQSVSNKQDQKKTKKQKTSDIDEILINTSARSERKQ
ncbi:uncharacterized protein LOC130612695 [Hydractinia symbiolongicarpus]|uniref:uncharacterized protein LOC130612695 n=1 Tax=Hydractinia symbiolongicarpus TaxID=13093 RepID=UPI00254E55A4|nr:uncharacterized protein LOC130612695 [Hydractinia symbiolongicarpus]